MQRRDGAREVRRAARLPLLVVAARAGVSETTARLYEINAEELKDVDKRAALDAVYDDLRARLGRMDDVAAGSDGERAK